MIHPIAFFTTLKNRRLSLRLLFAIGSCSLLFILLAIAFQLNVEYNRDIAGIESRFKFVETSYVPALTASAYQLDEEQVRLLLRGVLQLQDIVYVEVQEQLKKRTYSINEGDPEASGMIRREYQLVYPAQKLIPVGTLQVGASLDGVYARLKERAVTIAVSNALLIVPFSLMILIILQLALNRHLIRMAQYARTLNLDTLDLSLSLHRSAGRAGERDELDQLVHAINEMRLRIREDMHLRREAEKELLFRKTLLECILEAQVDGIFITNEDNTCLFSNSHFRSLWRLPVDCSPGTPAQPVFSRIEEKLQDPEPFLSILTELLESQQDVVAHGEISLLSGEIIEYNTVPVRNLEGLQYGRLWSFRDVSQRKTLEEQLRQSQKLETLGSLAGGVAHDFNNMLGVIMGHAELAINRLDPSHPLLASLKNIYKAAERSADLTRQLLAFARKQTVALKVLDLNKTVEGMLNMLMRLIGEDIDLVWLPGGNLGAVKMDPSQIDQILANLCINARDAIRDTGKITIETQTADFDEAHCAAHAGFVPGEYVLLAVSDNGCGMDSETQSHLFEPFFTTKEMGKGTGLGLATVYGIVKQNNGFVNVYSERGHGTTFKIYLPRHTGQTERIEKTNMTDPEERGDETILLVEDEPMILNMTMEMLEGLGYGVLPASTPGEAISLARGHIGEIRLLMTDVVMPEMNGHDLARNLLCFYPSLKCLFMSGYTANVIAHHGVLDTGVHFIQKPFTVKSLATKIREVLDQKPD